MYVPYKEDLKFAWENVSKWKDEAERRRRTGSSTQRALYASRGLKLEGSGAGLQQATEKEYKEDIADIESGASYQFLQERKSSFKKGYEAELRTAEEYYGSVYKALGDIAGKEELPERRKPALPIDDGYVHPHYNPKGYKPPELKPNYMGQIDPKQREEAIGQIKTDLEGAEAKLDAAMEKYNWYEEASIEEFYADIFAEPEEEPANDGNVEVREQGKSDSARALGFGLLEEEDNKKHLWL
jgi:hypothetical protein